VGAHTLQETIGAFASVCPPELLGDFFKAALRKMLEAVSQQTAEGADTAALVSTQVRVRVRVRVKVRVKVRVEVKGNCAISRYTPTRDELVTCPFLSPSCPSLLPS
jgi:hypothetical protein